MQVVDVGDEEMVALLLAYGADPDRQDVAGATALMWGAHRGHVDVVKKLLAAQANVSICNRAGYTALKLAEFNAYEEVVQLLKAFGAVG